MIEISQVSKRYVKLSEQAMLLRSIVPWTRPKRTEHWALRGVNFDVKSGELVGIIGHNGAGKTTLLRLLAGVTTPTSGSVRVHGRIAPLISIGVGFHPESTGRENVLVNGMLLGLTAQEVAEQFDSIVAFAELWDFIDTPVKFYSSGMTLRLGFAVIAHIDPAVLLVDEILAVGDARFQMKCLDRLREFQEGGATVLMVSHALHQVQSLCDRAILLNHGRVEWDGDVQQAIELHERLADSSPDAAALELDAVRFEEVSLEGEDGGDRAFEYDELIQLRLRLRFMRQIADPQLRVGLITGDGGFGGFTLTRPGERWRTFSADEECEVEIDFPARLGGGRYTVMMEVRSRDETSVLGRHRGPDIQVADRPGIAGMVGLPITLALERS